MSFFSGFLGQDAARSNRNIVSEAQGMKLPTRPEFQSLLDPSTGLLKKQYLATDTGDQNLQSVQDRLRQEGMRAPGAQSQWAQIANQQQATAEQGLRQKLDQSNAGAQANAQANLATRGGLRSGSAERLAQGGALQTMMGRQDIGQQGVQARQGISAQDEQSRQAGLQGLLGMETGNRAYTSDLQQKNIMNSMAEKRAKDAADMAAYQAQMQNYGAAKTAAATAGGGKKG